MASRTPPESSKCDFKFLLVFGLQFKTHFLHFRSHFGLQNRPQNRPKIDIGGQSSPRRFRTAFLEPFWHHFGLILGPPGLHFRAFIIPHLLLVSALGSSVLSARWPVSGAQPPAGSGHRAAIQLAYESEAECVEVFAWRSPSLARGPPFTAG